MKRKILVPMFASLMALSMNSVANADEVKDKKENDKNLKLDEYLTSDEYKESEYKTAVVKDGVAVKIRNSGDVKTVAYTGDEFKVIATQGDWVKVSLQESGEGWLSNRYVDIKESTGYITGDTVNFRKEANVNSDVIKELEKGCTVKVLEVSENWMKVKKGEDEGYIRSLYVSEDKPVIEVQEPVNNNIKQASNNTQSKKSQPSTTSNVTNNTNSSKGQTKKISKKEKNNNSNKPASSSKSSVKNVLDLAYSKMGCPYVWGSEGSNSFDCSGFTYYVFKNAAGINIPRTSSAQSGCGETVSKSNLQPGDLVFFNTSGKGVSHVGIYVGGGNMIHSPSSGKTVSVTSINSSYYSSKFVTAKRVL